jgi:hypothetical protein
MPFRSALSNPSREMVIVIKVEKLWSWLAAKGKGTRSSKKDGLVYRELPPIPEPKARVKARYTLVLINDSGKSRQIELTPLKLRLGLTALAAVLFVTVAVLLIAGGSVMRTAQSANEFESLSSRVRTLEEELGRKEQALTIQEKRLKEMQEAGAFGTVAPAMAADTSPLTGMAASRVQVQPDGGAVTPLSDIDRAGRNAAPPQRSAKEERSGRTGAIASIESSAGRGEATGSGTESESSSKGSASRARAPRVNFDVQDVTAVQDAPNDGKLSFQIVKDQPDIRFTGYLFVFVEMLDRRGETKVYAYPGQTSLGEGDLPSNYRVGEIIKEFRYNSRVKLDYKDDRQGATLAGASILLYGDDGKIVYQRHLDLKEMKVMSAKSLKADSARSKSAHKRQAL